MLRRTLERTNTWMIAIMTFFFIGLGIARAGTSFDYGRYAQVLSMYVDEEGLVDYRSLQENPEELEAFVQWMAKLDSDAYERLADGAKIAFWINAYNGLTLKAIVDHYPVDTIKEIGNIFRSVWDKLHFTVMGKDLTLNEIEHEILRKKFNEPRIHMALNCASMGCPQLRREPFSSERLDNQLDEQTRSFLADPQKFRIDQAAETVYLSPIFKWFGEDFVPQYGSEEQRPGLDDKEEAVLNFVSRYLEGEQRRFVQSAPLDVEYLDYDWSINEQRS